MSRQTPKYHKIINRSSSDLDNWEYIGLILQFFYNRFLFDNIPANFFLMYSNLEQYLLKNYYISIIYAIYLFLLNRRCKYKLSPIMYKSKPGTIAQIGFESGLFWVSFENMSVRVWISSSSGLILIRVCPYSGLG